MSVSLTVVHGSHPCVTVELALQQKGIPYKTVELPPPLHAAIQRVRTGKRTVPSMTLDGEKVTSFAEKPVAESAFVNGGFFLLSPKVGDLIESDETVWEHEPVNWLAEHDELRAFRHDGFWRPMDTLRDKLYLEEQWNSGQAKWKIW